MLKAVDLLMFSYVALKLTVISLRCCTRAPSGWCTRCLVTCPQITEILFEQPAGPEYVSAEPKLVETVILAGTPFSKSVAHDRSGRFPLSSQHGGLLGFLSHGSV